MDVRNPQHTMSWQVRPRYPKIDHIGKTERAFDNLVSAIHLATRICDLRTRTWSPKTRTKTCKLVLEDKDKDFPRGQQHWVTVKNGLLTYLYLISCTYISKKYLISLSKPFFTVPSCTVVVTVFMDFSWSHIRDCLQNAKSWQFSRTLWSKDKDLWSKDEDKDLDISPGGSSRTRTSRGQYCLTFLTLLLCLQRWWRKCKISCKNDDKSSFWG